MAIPPFFIVHLMYSQGMKGSTSNHYSPDVHARHRNEGDHDIKTLPDDDQRDEYSESLVDGESEFAPEHGVEFLVPAVASTMELRRHLQLVINELCFVQLGRLVVVNFLGTDIVAMAMSIVPVVVEMGIGRPVIMLCATI